MRSIEKEKAFKLSLITGAFGGHRFYLHQPAIGFAYLAFSWSAIPLVLSLIDAAFLYSMTDEEFQEEFNQQPDLAA